MCFSEHLSEENQVLTWTKGIEDITSCLDYHCGRSKSQIWESGLQYPLFVPFDTLDTISYSINMNRWLFVFDVSRYDDTYKVRLVFGVGVGSYGNDKDQYYFWYVVSFCGFLALQPSGIFDLSSYQIMYVVLESAKSKRLFYSKIPSQGEDHNPWEGILE